MGRKWLTSCTCCRGTTPRPTSRVTAAARSRAGEELPRLTHGAAVFVDISGFTPLTEALARGARRPARRRGADGDARPDLRGADGAAARVGGSVVYFSGDAVTAWIDGDDGSRATACGLAMQEVMDRVGVVQTPGGVAGHARREGRGGGGRGPPLRRRRPARAAHRRAGRRADGLPRRGRAAVASRARSSSTPARIAVAGRPRRAARGPRGRARRRRRGRVASPTAAPDPDTPARGGRSCPTRSPASGCCRRSGSGWSPAAGEFLAELRPAVPIFVRFGGLDFENDPDAPAGARRLRDPRRARPRRAGRLRPPAHDRRQGRLPVRRLRLAGRPRGRRRAGLRGGPPAPRDRRRRAGHRRPGRASPPGGSAAAPTATAERRTFCCLGDAVNLAARLMTRAPAGGIWVHGEVADAAGERFEWEELPAITVKGRKQPVAGPRGSGRAAAAPAPRRRRAPLSGMVGRDAELARLRELLATAAARARARWSSSRPRPAPASPAWSASSSPSSSTDGVPVAQRRGDAASRPRRRTPPGAASGPTCSALDPDSSGPDEVPTAVARLDPALGRPRAAAGPGARPAAARQRPDRGLRGRAAQDLPGGPAAARLLAARAARGGRRRARRRGRALARPALARPARGRSRGRSRDAPVLLAGHLATRRHAPSPGSPLGRGSHVTDLVLEPLEPEASAGPRRRAAPGARPGTTRRPRCSRRSSAGPRATPSTSSSSSTTSLAHAARADGTDDPDALELPPSLHSLVLSRIDAQPEGPRRAVKVASVDRPRRSAPRWWPRPTPTSGPSRRGARRPRRPHRRPG